jgi:hypothetical protein
MCFSAKVSISTFSIGIFFSLLLIFYGNKKYQKENIIFGLFFIIISLMQLFDFLFWIDLDNKAGINKITTLIAPLFNYGQPTILYLIKYFYSMMNDSMKNKIDILQTNNINDLLFMVLNIFYFINLADGYNHFIENEPWKTGVEKGHLKWRWLKYFSSIYYLIVLSLNTFYQTNFLYSFFVFIISTFFLIISYQYFNYHIGEIWCFFGSIIPLILFIVSYLI